MEVNKNQTKKELSSFRDPSGFVFNKDGQYYRQVNRIYQENYDLLMKSGLYKDLTDKRLLISHQEVSELKGDKIGYKIILPEQINFISYPYEWCFSQLKDAALLTLEIQTVAMAHGMSLKDASAYNVQFKDGRPILIDTLSFEKYEEGKPWIAYRQFCEHFLAPLALMAYCDLRLGKVGQLYIDGIPLDLTSKLLPLRTKFSLNLGGHIHFHARGQKNYSRTEKRTQDSNLKLSRRNLEAIVASLKGAVRSLNLPKQKTVWDDYYDHTNYSAAGFKHKEKIITEWIEKIKPKSVWDAGANDGYFSRIGSKKKILTLATDFDEIAIEKAYIKAKEEQDNNILPLIIDLTNPSPAIGWVNDERQAFLGRCHVDLTLSLALIHHLAIANNLPLAYIAKFFANQTKYLIAEFVPKKDSNAQKLLISREDIFVDYNQEEFEKEFSVFFKIKEKIPVKNSLRTLYLMEKKRA